MTTSPPPPRAPALRTGLVIHTRQVCYSAANPGWPPPTLPRAAHPAHGVITVCPACGLTGVTPERGYEFAFLPPGCDYNPESRTITVRLEH